MFLLYLDASGTANLKDVNTKHYVFLGLSMQEQDWSEVNTDLQSLKARYGYPGLGFELHVKQFAVTIKEQEKIPDFEKMSREDRRAAVLKVRDEALRAAVGDATRRDELKKRFRSTDHFIHLTRSERSQLLEDAVALIAGYDGIRLFADAISKSHPAVKEGRLDPVAEVFRQVIPRFDTFLDKIARKALDRNARARVDHGLLILDRDESTEATFHDLFKRFREDGTALGDLRHVIDVPFFADSEKVGGLQLADVGAYVVRRYLDTGTKPGSHEERQFKSIFRLFDRDPRGRLHGLRHYVPAGVCPCLICEERDHGPAKPPPPAAH
jgi:hypothetical protein